MKIVKIIAVVIVIFILLILPIIPIKYIGAECLIPPCPTMTRNASIFELIKHKFQPNNQVWKY